MQQMRIAVKEVSIDSVHRASTNLISLSAHPILTPQECRRDCELLNKGMDSNIALSCILKALELFYSGHSHPGMLFRCGIPSFSPPPHGLPAATGLWDWRQGRSRRLREQGTALHMCNLSTWEVEAEFKACLSHTQTALK